MGTILLLAFLAAAAAAASGSRSSASRTPATGGDPAVAPPPSGTPRDTSTTRDGAPPRTSTSSATAPTSTAPSSAWARARGSAPTSSARPSSRGRSDGGIAIESATPDQAARLVASAVHSGSSGMANAQRLAGRWLDVSTRSGTEVGRFVAQLQGQREDAIAEWSLDRWRSPAGTPSPSAPTSPTATASGDPAAGIAAASHALHLIASSAAGTGFGLASHYLNMWVREPHRTTIEVSRAARDLQAGGQEDLADLLLESWNEHEHQSAVA